MRIEVVCPIIMSNLCTIANIIFLLLSIYVSYYEQCNHLILCLLIAVNFHFLKKIQLLSPFELAKDPVAI